METEKTLNEQEKDLLWEHIKMLSEKAVTAPADTWSLTNMRISW